MLSARVTGAKQLESFAQLRTLFCVLSRGNCVVLVLLALAGCSTAPRQADRARAPDWIADEQQTPPPAPNPVMPASAPPPPVAPVPHPPVAPGPHYEQTWVPASQWCSGHPGSYVRQISSPPYAEFALTTTNGVLVFQVGTLVARWNSVELRLGFAPRMMEGEPCLHALDCEKNLDALLQPLSLPDGSGRVIVIDPGHGGANTGTRSVVDGQDEKVYTLDWAQRLEPLLRAAGWQVFLTRTNDIDIPLSARVAFAEQHQAELFVSLHFNSPGGGVTPASSYAGLETYCLTPSGMPSTLTRGYADPLSDVWPNNAVDADNVRLAYCLHTSLLRAAGMPDRGVRRARFMGVLRGQSCPAVLIEGGYLSNPVEARRIADPAYRQQLAEALSAALTAVAVPAHRPDIEPGLKLGATNNAADSAAWQIDP